MVYSMSYWKTLMNELTEYFSNTKKPSTINSALKEIGVIKGNMTRTVKILREKFPDEMKTLEQNHYCMPASSRGSIISGYFFVKYKDDIARYITTGLSMSEIYDILMSDPRNKYLDITKERFTCEVYAAIRYGTSPEIKKAHDEKMLKKCTMLDELYKDVMTSRPYKYDVKTICEKYNVPKSVLYTAIKYTRNGKELKSRLIYNENVNCTNRLKLIKDIKEMELDGFSSKEIAEKFGVSEGYVKYTGMVVEHLDELISKVQV